MKIRQRRRSMTGEMLEMGMGNIVGATMIGATAGVTNSIPAGTARDIARIVPAAQGVALVGSNLRTLKKRKLLY